MTLVVSTAAEQDVTRRSLVELDEAWGRCRDLVAALEAAHSEQLAHAVAIRRNALDAAWETYQQEIVARGPAGTGTRSERVARARARYNDAAAAAGGAYEASRAAALEAYVGGLEAACSSYEGSVDRAIRVAVGLDDPAGA